MAEEIKNNKPETPNAAPKEAGAKFSGQKPKPGSPNAPETTPVGINKGRFESSKHANKRVNKMFKDTNQPTLGVWNHDKKDKLMAGPDQVKFNPKFDRSDMARKALEERAERKKASELFGTDLTNGQPSWKQTVLERPEALEFDVVTMMESDPDKYDYDNDLDNNNWDVVNAKRKALREDLIKKLTSGEGDYDFTPEEAQKAVDAWLGTDEEHMQAQQNARDRELRKENPEVPESWREGREPLYTEEEWQDEQDESDQGQGDPSERMYVLRHMKEWMNEADNGPIDEDLMMEAYYQADEENGFDDTMSADEVWETVASKYDELMEQRGNNSERERASELYGTDLTKSSNGPKKREDFDTDEEYLYYYSHWPKEMIDGSWTGKQQDEYLNEAVRAASIKKGTNQ